MKTQFAGRVIASAVLALVLFLTASPPTAFAAGGETSLTIPKNDILGIEELLDSLFDRKPKPVPVDEKPIPTPEPATILTLGLGLLGLGWTVRKRK